MDSLQDKILLKRNGTQILAQDALKRTRTIIYFFNAANTPSAEIETLKKIGELSLERNLGVAIVFVFMEENEEDFSAEFEKLGNCFALSHDDWTKYELIYKYGISHVPNCVVVSNDGKIISLYGMNQLKEKGLNVLVSWMD